MLGLVRLGLHSKLGYLIFEAGEAQTKHLQQGVYAGGLQFPAPARDGRLVHTLQHPHKAHEQVPRGLAVQVGLHHLLVLVRVRRRRQARVRQDIHVVFAQLFTI